MDIYWADYEGNPVYYDTVQPGESHYQGTYATHPWGGMVNGELVGVFILTEDSADHTEMGVMMMDGQVALLCNNEAHDDHHDMDMDDMNMDDYMCHDMILYDAETANAMIDSGDLRAT